MSDVVAVKSLRRSFRMAVLSIARFLQKSPALGSQLRQMAVMENASPITSAVRRMSVITNQVPHSSGERRSRSSSRGSLFVATSASAYAAYSISTHPVMGGAGQKDKKKLAIATNLVLTQRYRCSSFSNNEVSARATQTHLQPTLNIKHYSVEYHVFHRCNTRQ